MEEEKNDYNILRDFNKACFISLSMKQLKYQLLGLSQDVPTIKQETSVTIMSKL